MKDVTRRRFLTHGTAGVAAAGALAAVPGLAGVLRAPAPALSGAEVASAEPLIAHVRDLASGEISLMVGTREIVQRDPALAARLYAATRHVR